MKKRCSHCSHNGHNNRTCPTRHGGAACSGTSSSSSSNSLSGGVKIFGVRLMDGSFIKKSASMGNLSSTFHSCPDSSPSDHLKDPADDEYLSDDPSNHGGCSSTTAARRLPGERKKGIPWTEKEHRLFLIGLQKLGKGDWRGISRNFVMSRTPTQVASHAQKYFIRQSNSTRRKRRSSLFDMAPDAPVQEEHEVSSSQVRKGIAGDAQPSLDLTLRTEYRPMETAPPGTAEAENNDGREVGDVIPGFFSAYVPAPYDFWHASSAPFAEGSRREMSRHEVVKPVAKKAVNGEEVDGISRLSLGENRVMRREATLPPLCLKLVGESSRQSAFHANSPEDNRKSSAITAL